VPITNDVGRRAVPVREERRRAGSHHHEVALSRSGLERDGLDLGQRLDQAAGGQRHERRDPERRAVREREQVTRLDWARCMDEPRFIASGPTSQRATEQAASADTVQRVPHDRVRVDGLNGACPSRRCEARIGGKS
jgi:hypothetical protein